MISELNRSARASSDLVRFALLFSVLYSAFGVASPFLPMFLSSRTISPEQIGLIISLSTFVRIVSGPIAGRMADRLGGHVRSCSFRFGVPSGPWVFASSRDCSPRPHCLRRPRRSRMHWHCAAPMQTGTPPRASNMAGSAAPANKFPIWLEEQMKARV
jgi:hypothetical protein